MPYLKIQTNLPVGKKAERNVLKSASALVAQQLEKPEGLVMIALQPDTAMLFAGTDDPVAFLELKAIGLPGKKPASSARHSATWSRSTSASPRTAFTSNSSTSTAACGAGKATRSESRRAPHSHSARDRFQLPDMATYVYETIPQQPGERPKRFEAIQSMKDAPLTRHPDTGERVRRVISGGFGLMGVGSPAPAAAPATGGCGAGCGCHHHH